MSAIGRGTDAPELHETHLLCRVCGLEEGELGGEEGGGVDAVAGEDYGGCVGVGGGGGPGGVRGVVVVLRYGVGDCFGWGGGLVDWCWCWWGRRGLEGEGAGEEGGELFLRCCHGGGGWEPVRGGSVAVRGMVGC